MRSSWDKFFVLSRRGQEVRKRMVMW